MSLPRRISNDDTRLNFQMTNSVIFLSIAQDTFGISLRIQKEMACSFAMMNKSASLIFSELSSRSGVLSKLNCSLHSVIWLFQRDQIFSNTRNRYMFYHETGSAVLQNHEVAIIVMLK